MAEIEKKEVVVSLQFETDIAEIFEYGEETFGYSAAKVFVGEAYNLIWNLDSMYLTHLECRHIPTKHRMYRNIILGSYLILYRIASSRVEVLRMFSSYRSVAKIKAARRIKL